LEVGHSQPDLYHRGLAWAEGEVKVSADLLTELDALEREAAALGIRWWHLVAWWYSPVRTVAVRFRAVEPQVRTTIEELRAKRSKHWMSMENAASIAPWLLVIAANIELQDQETALSARLERGRFLLISKESEEHAKRSVLLGVIGAVLGVVSLVLGVVSLGPWS
jgi:hypothetical protein